MGRPGFNAFPRVLRLSPTSPPNAWLPILHPTPLRAQPRGRWADMGTDRPGAPGPAPRHWEEAPPPTPAGDQSTHYAYICVGYQGIPPTQHARTCASPKAASSKHPSGGVRPSPKTRTGLVSAEKPERTPVYIWSFGHSTCLASPPSSSINLLPR